MNTITQTESEFTPINPTGNVVIPAQRTSRNGHPTFIAAIPFKLLFEIVEPIQPGTALSYNRKVEPKRMEEIGKYFLEQPDWMFPPILLDTEEPLDFEPLRGQQFEGSGYRIEGVWLKIPSPRKILKILDGQHRFMGNYLKWEQKWQELSRAKARRLDAINDGDEERVNKETIDIESLQNQVDKYERETLTVEIITQVSESLHKKWFTTVAEKAEGIGYSARTRLDEISVTSVVSNNLAEIYEMFLKKNGKPNIEVHQNLARRAGEEVYSLANIRDWTKNVAFGTTDKATLKRESDLNSNNLYEIVEEFLDILKQNFKIFQQLEKHLLTGSELRKESLLSSPTIIRALAGAYHEICISKVETGNSIILESKADAKLKFQKMLKELEPYLAYKSVNKKLDVHENWRKIGSTSSGGSAKDTVFRSSGIAPQSGFQERQVLTDLFIAWTESGKVFDPLTVPKQRGK